MSRNIKHACLAAAFLAVGATLLSGCSSVSDLMSREVTSHYDDRSAMESAPDWVPDDATDITVRTPADTSTGTAVVLLASSSDLPGSCAEAPRSSAPMLKIKGRPDVYKAETVMVCGDWSVLAADDGWFGWTPNAGDAPE